MDERGYIERSSGPLMILGVGEGDPYQPAMTVNQAIALAGGLTERASVDKIFIFKESSTLT